MAVTMKFYNDVDENLKNYIKHYWTTSGTLKESGPMKILPMDHIDLVIPIVGERAFFYFEDKLEDSTSIYFHGMRDVPVSLVQEGHVECIGISFKPWGFYAFIEKPLHQYKNKTVDFLNENPLLAMNIINEVNAINTVECDISNYIKKIEKHLINSIDLSKSYLKDMMYICASSNKPLAEIADSLNISTRTLERNFKKYIGTSPSVLFKILKFEGASRLVLHEQSKKLTDIAYDMSYFDQAHFSRDFKKFTKETANSIRKSKNALKSNMNYE